MERYLFKGKRLDIDEWGEEGKRLDIDEWVEGYYASFDLTQVGKYGVSAIFERMENAEVFGSCVGGLWHSVIPETVGQYTGVDDINGVKIFEGDVVRYNIPNEDGGKTTTCGVIQYDMDWLTWVVNDGKCTEWLSPQYTLGDDVEVIGNIHDDPEPKLMEVNHAS